MTRVILLVVLLLSLSLLVSSFRSQFSSRLINVYHRTNIQTIRNSSSTGKARKYYFQKENTAGTVQTKLIKRNPKRPTADTTNQTSTTEVNAKPRRQQKKVASLPVASSHVNNTRVVELITQMTKKEGNSSLENDKQANNTINSVVVSNSSEAIGTVSPRQELPMIIQLINQYIIEFVKNILSLVYGNRDIARFAALETIARVPYFAYTSVLHFYETFGFFEARYKMKLHFAESWNELHHLLILDSLGGRKYWFDRLVAQIIAFVYYWMIVGLYLTFPAIAYDLNKYVEKHAYEAYAAYLNDNEKELKNQDVPKIAREYYEKEEEKYMITACNVNRLGLEDRISDRDSRHSNSSSSKDRESVVKSSERKLTSLYDVFERIRDDELDHARTMDYLEHKVLEAKS